jgi:hypothetical protein
MLLRLLEAIGIKKFADCCDVMNGQLVTVITLLLVLSVTVISGCVGKEPLSLLEGEEKFGFSISELRSIGVNFSGQAKLEKSRRGNITAYHQEFEAGGKGTGGYSQLNYSLYRVELGGVDAAFQTSLQMHKDSGFVEKRRLGIGEEAVLLKDESASSLGAYAIIFKKGNYYSVIVLILGDEEIENKLEQIAEAAELKIS